MSCSRALLCVLLPPLAVLDKGCGSIALVSILTLIGWLPGVLAALIIASRQSPQVVAIPVSGLPAAQLASADTAPPVPVLHISSPQALRSKTPSTIAIAGGILLVSICVCTALSRVSPSSEVGPSETLSPSQTPQPPSSPTNTPTRTHTSTPTLTPTPIPPLTQTAQAISASQTSLAAAQFASQTAVSRAATSTQRALSAQLTQRAIESASPLTSPHFAGIFGVGIDIAPGRWQVTDPFFLRGQPDCYWARYNSIGNIILDSYGDTPPFVIQIASTDSFVELDRCGKVIYLGP